MSYNLLLDTEFKQNNWKFTNCRLENGMLISTDKVFGIEQELTLPDPTKLYFKFTYTALNPSLKDVKIGIQTNDVIHVNKRFIRWNKTQKISVVENVEQEKIKLHLIFESDTKVNKVYIKNPILIDLVQQGKSTWLKSILDRTIRYRYGYAYKNLFKTSELKDDLEEFKNLNIESAKIGSIVSLKNKEIINLNAKFIRNQYYLAKLDFKEINNLGDIYFQYGVLKSSRIEDEQIWLVFKANDNLNLQLVIESNDALDYKINLKHLMIIDITNLKLLKNDITNLPFI